MTIHSDRTNIAPKTREGYYHYTGGINAAIKRSLAFAPYSDLTWLETKRPDLNQAKSFARKIREQYPDRLFVYNLSPSFNWIAEGFTNEGLKNFVWDLGKEGYVFSILTYTNINWRTTDSFSNLSRWPDST